MVFPVLLILGWIGLMAQFALGSPHWMFGGQFLPLLMILLYACIFTHSANAWMLALVFGFLWDAQLGSRLGVTSACLIAMVGLVMTQPLAKIRNTPLLQLLVCVAAITFFLVLHFVLAFGLERQRFIVGAPQIWSVAASSLMNGALCILLFALVHPVLVFFGHQPPRDLKYHV